MHRTARMEQTTNRTTRGRAVRKRPLAVLLAVVAVSSGSSFRSVHALSAAVHSRAGVYSTSIADPVITERFTPIDTSMFEDAELDDFEISQDMQGVVRDLKKLQEHTYEILPAEMQRLIDTGCPESFLETLGGESELEKMAMKTITEQLPQPDLEAFTKKNSHLVSSTRVTAKQEIELAKIIQAGASLFRVKQETEGKLGKPISKAEWAKAVGLSPKLLRQSVSAYRQAKHKLVSANLGLVHAVVNQMYRNDNSIPKEELIQEGSLGLLRAAELFDPERGLRFSTYAVVWIKGTLSNSHVRELVRIPSREKTKLNQLAKIERELAESGEDGSIENIARLMGMTVEQLLVLQRKREQATNLLSLDAQRTLTSRSGGESNPVESQISVEEEDLAIRTQLQLDLIAAMVNNLDAREARLMRLRYGISDGHARTLQECAECMGLSYSRVRQLSERCLEKLRAAAEAESLQEYLLTIA